MRQFGVKSCNLAISRHFILTFGKSCFSKLIFKDLHQILDFISHSLMKTSTLIVIFCFQGGGGGLSSNTQVSLNLIKGGLTCSIRDFPTLEEYIDEIDVIAIYWWHGYFSLNLFYNIDECIFAKLLQFFLLCIHTKQIHRFHCVHEILQTIGPSDFNLEPVLFLVKCRVLIIYLTHCRLRLDYKECIQIHICSSISQINICSSISHPFS